MENAFCLNEFFKPVNVHDVAEALQERDALVKQVGALRAQPTPGSPFGQREFVRWWRETVRRAGQPEKNCRRGETIVRGGQE